MYICIFKKLTYQLIHADFSRTSGRRRYVECRHTRVSMTKKFFGNIYKIMQETEKKNA